VDDDDLLSCFHYVVTNPVQAGLCRTARDWEWSSYRAAVGLADPPSFVDPRPVLSCFGEQREFAVDALRDFVESS
jgi:hypothetical protein